MNRMYGTLALAAAAAVTALTAEPSNARADDWFNCSVSEVMEKSGFIHARCSNSYDVNGAAAGGLISYMVIDKADWDSAGESRFVSMATSALLAGRSFRVWVLHDTANNPSGCSTTDCRAVGSFGMR